MLNKLTRHIVGGLATGIFALGVMALVTMPVLSQVIAPRSFAARLFPTQQTHYIRFVVNFNSCPIPAAAATCNFKVGSLPYNAFLTSIHYQVITTFNPTTSATISLGTNTTGTNILAATSVFTGVVTTAFALVASASFAGQGELVTGAGAAQTGTLGNFDLFAVYTTGANGSQGTQGQVVFVLSYIAPNDGACTVVPLGATAAAC